MQARAFSCIGMWIGIKFILLVRQPKPTIRIEDFFRQRRQKLLEYAPTIDPCPLNMNES